MLCVGIDLGTSNSVIAVSKNGSIETIPVANWKSDTPNILPSLVDCTPEKLEINTGKVTSYTVSSIKRSMGNEKEFFGYSPSEISGVILKHLVKSCEEYLGEKVEQAIITVPAYFDDIQRLATKLAASFADLKVMRLVNEPTAAAVAYDLENRKDERIAVYDLGGGTFDFSILKISNGVFQVLATAGNTQLGGDDIDHDIAEFCCARYGARFDSLDENDKKKCLYVARELKEKKAKFVFLVLKSFTAGFYLEPNELKNIIFKRLEKTKSIAESALEDAELSVSDLDNLILIGGMTKSEEVREFVRTNFACNVLDNINPDETVAIGAAKYAESIISSDPHSLLIDVTPLTLGVETLGGNVDPIIFRNSPIPFEQTVQYTTAENNQKKMFINVVQGESNMVENCRSLGRFELDNIPPMQAGVARVNVNFKIDVNGILRVSAWESNSDEKISVNLEPSEGLTEKNISQMIQK